MLDHVTEEGHKKNDHVNVNDIVIPTPESIKIIEFFKLAINHEFPFLVIGPTGTGKSLFINNHLKSLSLESYLMINVTFSAKTTAL
mmetsp:Transcript_28688/g.25696  ORF Transcript_28688/g.25696 Transcript_28688/m.25696 type:complete len:86 (-) Transcript_28688:143-400(-)